MIKLVKGFCGLTFWVSSSYTRRTPLL